MPKVRLLTSMAGISFSHNAGDIIDCNDAEAARFIDAGIAESIDAPTTNVEKATAKRKVETATKAR